MTDPDPDPDLSAAGASNADDAQLLWLAIARADALLGTLGTGRPTGQELSALLDYVREVLLARITEEERTVFPALAASELTVSDVEQLRREHLTLREDIDDLAAAASHGAHDRDQLAAVTRRLIGHLETHVRREAATLKALSGGRQAVVSSWATAQRWYPLTEGQVIDVDQLQPDQVEDAVLNRLVHLRPDEHIALHGRTGLDNVWRRLQRRAPGEYSWSHAIDDVGLSTVSVARRRC